LTTCLKQAHQCGMYSGSFPLISSPDEIFYFLIRKSKTMLIDSVDFGMIWKEQKPPKWHERCSCLCSKFDRLPSPWSKLSTLRFEQTLQPIFSSAFNRFDRFSLSFEHFDYVNIDTLQRTRRKNNTTGKFNSQNYRVPDHTVCQLFRTQKKIQISATFR